MLRAVGAGAKFPLAASRAIAVGDSHQSMGFHNQNVPTTAGSFVVSGGIATITAAGTLYGGVSNWFHLSNQGDPLAANPLNNVMLQVATKPSNSVITFPATYNGVTLADGDYSAGFGGVAWTIEWISRGTDSSLVQYVKYRNGNPFTFVGLYGSAGWTGQQQAKTLAKILAGPRFDTVFQEFGTNDVGGGGGTTAQAALAGAMEAYRAHVTLANAFLATGAKVILWSGVPVPTGVTNASFKNQALTLLREQLIQFAQSTQGVTLLDTYAAATLGTVVGGDMVNAYEHTTTDVHFGSYGCYTLGNQIFPTISNLVQPAEIGPVSLADDGITNAELITAWVTLNPYTATSQPSVYVSNAGNIYVLLQSGTSGATGPTGTGASIADGGCIWAFVCVDTRNLVQNGGMAGTVAVAGVTNASGTLPTGWGIANSVTNCTLTSTGQAALNAVAGTNKGNFGFGWNLSGVFSAAGSYVLTSNDWGSVWRSASPTFGGGWFRAGITLQATTTAAVLQSFVMQIRYSTTVFNEAVCGLAGNNTTTLPLASTDNPMEYATEPFYVQPGVASSQSQMVLTVTSSAAGTVALQISSAWCRRVAAP